jgi:hypothetical protein
MLEKPAESILAFSPFVKSWLYKAALMIKHEQERISYLILLSFFPNPGKSLLNSGILDLVGTI